MCGIAGIVYQDQRKVEPKYLKDMAEVLSHRGPDAEGYFINDGMKRDKNAVWKTAKGNGNVGLAHRRLSIIDLSSGHQPMTNENEKIWLVFNGEIYNFKELKSELTRCGHKFNTNSDTEVIVHGYEEWGRNCVRKFRGMFSFALWDESKQSLFLSRDRLGIKPLYYYVDDSKFIFGSEIKAILQQPEVERELDPRSLFDYLSLMYVPGPGSIFKGINKLLPGHNLTVKKGEIIDEQYWDIEFKTNIKLSENDWCEKIVSKLKESIDIRLISDVPLGAFLSGGVDSSSVVALMSSLQTSPVQTSSIGFGEKAYNELPFAREIADKFNTDHHEMTVTPDALKVLDDLTWYYDEPFADSSAIPTYYVSKIAREKVTVALSGDGGDENFAGYRRYFFDNLENRIRGILPSFFRHGLIAPLANIYPKADRLPQIFRGKTMLTNLSLDPVAGYYNTMSWFHEAGKKILSPSIQKTLNGYNPSNHFYTNYDRVDTRDPLSKVQYIDIKTYLVDDILTKVDRASMAHSLEVRVPILDHELMELIATIPSNMKLRGKQGKYIFKKALQPVLPNKALFRKKMGFSIPLSSWLRNEFRPIFEKQVLSSNGFTANYLNRSIVQEMWQAHLDKKRDYSFELWAILFLEKWGRKWC